MPADKVVVDLESSHKLLRSGDSPIVSGNLLALADSSVHPFNSRGLVLLLSRAFGDHVIHAFAELLLEDLPVQLQAVGYDNFWLSFLAYVLENCFYMARVPGRDRLRHD